MQGNNIFQAVTFAVAALGAVLGVINTWRAIGKDRVKLKVTPKHAIPVGTTNQRVKFCIDVLNLSSFSVTVTEVGVLFKGTKVRGVSVNPLIFDGGSFPRRLEPRTSFTVYFLEETLINTEHRIKCAYAATDCGVLKKGKSAAFKQLIKEYK